MNVPVSFKDHFSKSYYVPKEESLSDLMYNLNNCSKHELAIPSNWSPELFFHDLLKYPVRSKNELISCLDKFCKKKVPYLDFFFSTRNFHRGSQEDQYCSPNIWSTMFVNDVWTVFETDSIMLYFEDLFLDLIKYGEMCGNIRKLYFTIVKEFSKIPMSDWDTVAEKYGALCFNVFINSPLKYVEMVYNSSLGNSVLTDQNILGDTGIIFSSREEIVDSKMMS
jgi:hypothetical protein